MWGAIVGAAAGAATSIFGAAKAASAAKKARQAVLDQQANDRNWYDQRYNEDATQRADAQRVLTALGERLKQRGKQAAGVQAVMGSSQESVAAEKASQAGVMASAMSDIVADGEKRRDAVEAAYRSRQDATNKELRDLEYGRAANIANATAGIGQSIANLGSSIDSAIDAKNAIKQGTNGNS